MCDSVSIASTDADTAAADITDLSLSPSHLAVSSSSVAVVKPCVSTSAINVSLLFTADTHDDSVDRAWREHVNEVLNMSSGTGASSAVVESRAVRTFHLFPRLFYVSGVLFRTCLTPRLKNRDLKKIYKNSDFFIFKSGFYLNQIFLIYLEFLKMFLLYSRIRTWNLNCKIALEDNEVYFHVIQCYKQYQNKHKYVTKFQKIRNDS